MDKEVFIIDCPYCKRKVAADKKGSAENSGLDVDIDEPYGDRLYIGVCQECGSLLAGHSSQVEFSNYNSEYDRWSEIIRVFPKPPKFFNSLRIPFVVKESLNEADSCLESGACTAACVMFGRALEAVCRDILEPGSLRSIANRRTKPRQKKVQKKKIMLAQGIRELKDKNIIDQRLFDWSQQLQAFRNLAAHPDDASISKEDASDLQSFVYAIVEYIYDLTDRYNDFKQRQVIAPKNK